MKRLPAKNLDAQTADEIPCMWKLMNLPASCMGLWLLLIGVMLQPANLLPACSTEGLSGSLQITGSEA